MLDGLFASWVAGLGYAVGSLEDVIIPSLKRLNREHTGVDISVAVNQALSTALTDIKQSKDSNN